MNIAVTEAQNQSAQAQESASEKHNLNAVQMPNVIANAVAGAAGTPVTAQTTATTRAIPQDFATMSEHDLISYINPSCFEKFN